MKIDLFFDKAYPDHLPDTKPVITMSLCVSFYRYPAPRLTKSQVKSLFPGKMDTIFTSVFHDFEYIFF